MTFPFSILKKVKLKLFENLENNCARNFLILKHKFSQLNDIFSVIKRINNLNISSQWVLSTLSKISFEVVRFNVKAAARNLQQAELQMTR